MFFLVVTCAVPAPSRYTKLLGAVGILLLLATAAANVWGVRAVNESVLPGASHSVGVLLDREVIFLSSLEKALLHTPDIRETVNYSSKSLEWVDEDH